MGKNQHSVKEVSQKAWELFISRQGAIEPATAVGEVIRFLDAVQTADCGADEAAQAENGYEIEKSLVLSTRHITQEDARKLETWSAAYKKGDYGFWLYVPGLSDLFHQLLDRCRAAGFSSTLIYMLALTRELGCCWLMLDRDGPVRDDMPKFDW